MKSICSCILSIFILSATGNAAALPKADRDTSESVLPLQTTLRIGKSVLFYTPTVNQSRPMTFTVSVRVCELFENVVTLLIGRSNVSTDYPEYDDRMLASAFEIRMSPEFWHWYRPSIGIGWFYSEWWPNWTGDRNRGTFFSLSLIGVAPRRLTLPIRLGRARSCIQPIVTAGDIRFGPIVPWGKHWSENRGNYYLEITLFSIGVTLW